MIPGQTPLTTITIAKDQGVTYQPLLLCQIDMVDGTSRYFSSENNDLTEGGNQYKGLDWRPRIQQQTLGALQSVSDQGIIQLPQVTIKFADADKEMWINDELLIGYKGGKMTLKFVFWDADTNVFSSDEQIKFVGVCNAPNADDTSLTITATNILNLANYNLPPSGIRRTCGWLFPVTFGQRKDGLFLPDSVYFPCGYSPDVNNGNGGFGYGNMDPATGMPFTDCTYTWDACIDRLGNRALADHTNDEGTPLQIEQDQMGRPTGHFGGIHYDPPLSWRSREYSTGNIVSGLDNPNDAKLTDFFPQVYGTSFVTPPVMVVEGDANQTYFEIVLGLGPKVQGDFSKPDPIQLVVVNDIVVPFRLQSTDASELGWNWINGGDRKGHVSRDTFGNGRGDPYGYLIAISVTVPKAVQDSSGIPNVQVLWNGQFVKVFHSTLATDFTEQSSVNPVWNLLDILTWTSLTIADIDLQTFIDAAAVADGMVTYTDLTGNPDAQHSRYRMGLTLRSRRSAAEIVNNVLASFKGKLAPNGGIAPDSQGLMQLYVDQTLADQQPLPIPGSNDNTPWPSATAAGAVDNVVGYVAYHFDESTILREGPQRNSPSTFKLEQRSNADTPNILGVDFQDEDYSYTTDTLSMSDSEAIGRSLQQTTGGVAAEGIVNFDQGKRVIETQFATQYRGNPRSGAVLSTLNDSGGTWIATFDASFRASHLRVGHIIAIDYEKYGIVAQQFRVLSLAPSMNFEHISIRAQWHEDDWYLDSYGQRPDPILQAATNHRLLRPPFGWLPDQVAPLANDPIFSPTDKTFNIAQTYEAAADNTAIARVLIQGHLPVNDFKSQASPPYAPQAESDPTGGTVPDGFYYICLVAVDSNGNASGPSYPLAPVVAASSGADTNTLTLPNIYWQSNTASWRLYAGTDPNRVSLQSSGTGTPSEITIDLYKVADQGLPDIEFDHMELRLSRVVHSGIFGAEITGITATTITYDAIPGIDLTNRTVSILGRANTSDWLPVWDFKIASNTSNVMTLSGVTDLTALVPAPKIGDVIVVRAQANITVPSANNVIGDTGFVNGAEVFDAPINVSGATNTTPIIITTSTPHDYFDGDTVLVSGVGGITNVNGTFTVTIPSTADANYDRTHVILVGSVGNGDFTHGGRVQLQTTGLRTNFEIGNWVLIISGTGAGQQRKIYANDQHKYVIAGTWSTPPDDTSVFIIIEPNILTSADSTPVLNSDPNAETELSIRVDNYNDTMVWAQAFCMSASGKQSIAGDSPGRELWIFGGTGNVVTQFDKATFNAAVATDLIVQDDISVAYIVKRPGVPVSISTKISVPPIGADVHLDIILTKHDGSYSGTILPPSTVISIPAGSTSVITQTAFKTGIHFDEEDVLTLNCYEIGSTQAGRQVACVCKFLLD